QAFWESARTYFEQTLDLDDALVTRLGQAPPPADRRQLAEDVSRAVLRQAARRCLVLLDFEDEAHQQFFRNIVSPAVESAGFTVHRLDEQESAGDILDLFLARLDDCHAVIADLTGFNSNVLYELGRVHHHERVQPLMLFRGSESQDLPFYISKYLVHVVKPDGSGAKEVIKAYLSNENNMRSDVGPRDGSVG
ncbi:MAG: hypothetical protein AAGD38_07295, partial [Acidobacteriota bacterium]